MPTPRGRKLALVAAAALALVLATSGGGSRRAAPAVPAAEGWRGLVGEARPQVAIGQRVIVILRAPALADRVAAVGGRAGDVAERRWTVAAFAAQQQLLSKLAARGVSVRPDYRYVRVVNGFSAALDPQAVALVERAPEVAAVYPVRAAYPASVSHDALRGSDQAWARPHVTLGGFGGDGVTIGLLDTGVQRAHPYLHGRVQRGYDVLGNDDAADADEKPDGSGELERHGTEMAGILVGSGGPGELAGIAPGARVLPIRVAGWQSDASGAPSVFARTDQILAGLERAVDPNADGDAHDAVRVALVALSAPFDAFADGPLARGAAGALRLDTLVVVPAGNDGPAGPAFGSLSGPGGAPAALTVAALDDRARARSLRVVVRSGLDVRLDRRLPLAGAVAPAVPRELALARVPAPAAAPDAGPVVPAGATLADFFDARGFSRVAGRAALVPAGAEPQRAVRNAVAAGAAAVLLYGPLLPAGALGVDDAVPVPVVSVPETAASPLLRDLRAGARIAVALGSVRTAANERDGEVAPFSSRGLAFDGRVKPELAASGVAVATSTPGRNDDGSPRYVTVNGSSAAAATVAGAAALVLQARPGLDGPALRSLLIGSARPLRGQAPAAQGNGLLDVGAALATELAAAPATLAFGRASGERWRGRRTLLVRNLSMRPLTIYLDTGTRADDAVRVLAPVRRIDLSPGTTARVRLTARVTSAGTTPSAAFGTLTLTPPGARVLRVPWSILLGPAPAGLVGGVSLSSERFVPSDDSPAVLSLDAGRVLRLAGGDAVEPVARLEVELWSGDGRRRLGTIARLRDLLPGRYTFGVTGRGPSGGVLPPGVYLLRLVAHPTASGAPSVALARFAVLPRS